MEMHCESCELTQYCNACHKI